MSLPVTVEKVFANVLARRFADVHRGGGFADLSGALDRRLMPIVCVCEEANPVNQNGRRSWAATVAVEVCSLRDLPLDLADAFADGVFAHVAEHEEDILDGASACGWQFGNLKPGPQTLRTGESVRVISASYEMLIALPVNLESNKGA